MPEALKLDDDFEQALLNLRDELVGVHKYALEKIQTYATQTLKRYEGRTPDKDASPIGDGYINFSIYAKQEIDCSHLIGAIESITTIEGPAKSHGSPKAGLRVAVKTLANLDEIADSDIRNIVKKAYEANRGKFQALYEQLGGEGNLATQIKADNEKRKDTRSR